ncbi:MAG: hypothetical protein WEB06_11990 [Actinomycetota bacterium]
MGTDWTPLHDVHPGLSVRTERIDGRVTVVGVRLERPDGLRGEDLRKLPTWVKRAELAWNWPERVVTQKSDSWETVPTKRELRLPSTPGHRKPDDFYVTVGGLYRRLVANGVRPAPALAEANRVPETTVHRWIREARRRGFLAPGRKGRAG